MDSLATLMREVVFKQYEPVVTPVHPVPDKESGNAKSTSVECAARTRVDTCVDGAAFDGLGEELRINVDSRGYRLASLFVYLVVVDEDGLE
jgi:hypothetical protein